MPKRTTIWGLPRKFNQSLTTTEFCAFVSDNTYALTDVSGGTNLLTGTYTPSKSGKQIALTLDANSLVAFESNVVAAVVSAVESDLGITGVTGSAQHVTLGKIAIKNGVLTETTTIRGKASATVGGRHKSKRFSVKQARTGWTLLSGTAP
jgi:hypothetical protein